jgi:hypothetical protein
MGGRAIIVRPLTSYPTAGGIPVIDRSRAEALDRALDARPGDRSVLDPDLASLLATASLVRRAVPALPASAGLERRLAARLAPGNPVTRRLRALGDATRRELRHPGALVLTGAVSSAAVGCLTALAVWRGTRRTAAHRLVGR